MFKEEKATEAQKKYILLMQEMSMFPLPDINLDKATKTEASNYITKYNKLAHTDCWSIVNGYD